MAAVENRVSIVIPVRGKSHLLQRALTSYFIQTMPPSEILLIDDNRDTDEKRIVENVALSFELLVQSTKIPTRFTLISSGGQVHHQHEIWEFNIQIRTS